MSELRDRFLELYDYAVLHKIVSSQADFCRKVGISTSLMTEIKRGRSQLGLSAIQGVIRFFRDLNARNFILSEGDLFAPEYDSKLLTQQGKPILNEPVSSYSRSAKAEEVVPLLEALLEEKDKVIAQMEITITAQQTTIEQLQEKSK